MFKVLFPCLTVLGLFLLVRSALRLWHIYTAGQQEFPATMPLATITLASAGTYEIDIKRPGITGIIRPVAGFEVRAQPGGSSIPVTGAYSLLAGRKDLRGARIVPVAQFTIGQPGDYTLTNPDTRQFKDSDRILVMPKTGARGVLMILATIFSVLLFTLSLLLSMLAFRGKI